MAVSLEQFSRQLVESGVFSEPDLRAFLDNLPETEKPADGEQLAKRLVKEKKISAYQAQVVYSSKGKSLTMGSYFVLDKLGQGGMGMVLKAEHRMMKRLVAIKVLSPTVTKTKELQQRFQREVQAAARLTHPNIVGAFDAGEANGSPFLVMEYVAGDDLSAIVKKKGPLTVDQAIDCITQAARGLEFAHSQGVIHRDIKPANLLMDTKGVVKILDMGLARIEATDVATQADLTGTGAVMGTVDYMAPEQALSTKHADARSDLYSLGISLWYLLIGRSAYEGDSLMARLLAHREQPIPSLRKARGDIPESVEHIFSKLVAKKKVDRYQTATDLIVDLQSCKTGGSIKAVTVAEAATGPDEFQNFLQQIDSPTEGPRGARSNPSMTDTRTVTRPVRNVAAAEETMSQPDLSDTQRIRRQVVRKSKAPPWLQDWRAQIGGAATAVILLLAAVFLFQTPDGTLRVEILDPEVEMKVKGTQLSFHGVDLDPVSLKVGQKKLQVTRGDLVFDTESFEIKKGKESRVKVELIGDNLVVNGDGKLLAEKPIRRKAITSSTTNEIIRKGSLQLGSQGSTPVNLDDLPETAYEGFDRLRKVAKDEAAASGLKNNFPGISASHGLIAHPDGTPTGTCRINYDLAGRFETLDGIAFCRPHRTPPIFTEIFADGKSLWKSTNLAESKTTGVSFVIDVRGVRQLSLVATSENEMTAAHVFWKEPRLTLAGGPLFMNSPGFQQWINDVQVKPAELQVEAVTKKLAELNPSFDGTVRLKKIESGVVTDFRVHSDYLKDISPVRALTGLKRLHLAGSSFGKGKLTDLSPLQGLKLEYFDCGWTDVVDFSPLVDVPLQVLNFGGTKVSDLTPLRNMRLTQLDGPQSQVSDLGPLKGMPLTELFLDSCPVSDLSPLKGMPLKKLRVPNSKVVDLSPLAGCPLEELNCNENPPISDLTPLKGLTLKSLGCKNTRVADLSPIKEMPLLHLEYDFKEPRDLEIVRSIKTLERINSKPAAEFWKTSN